MDETAFLRDYDPARYDRPSIAVDLILASVVPAVPIARTAALLVRRDVHPHHGRWALPGGFVGIDESLDDAARRVLAQRARMPAAYLEQLHTFGAVGRDPRTRIVSVAYLALLPPARFAAALAGEPALTLAALDVDTAGAVVARPGAGAALPLAFDHAEMLALAMRRLRGKLGWSDVAFALLPDRFTLRALQDVHEAILGTRLNKPAFRRRMLDGGRLVATGDREPRAAFRPAELYRVRAED